ncbi:hypothetical protein C8F04DRAFT_1197817 [Mycena alexandri]|uniref:Uncharacterized protein n=1 Tax=Mycena alexandri TaxID=1745969 RepID=A0AAD6S1R7_9AGAR|nr:hypothetical protein C8F04DRAFT_1204402 [Mycena alexandri]KAJ7019320.1 hypothetical protein C8F04DRAFT_1197817 [Mycena alexandri]
MTSQEDIYDSYIVPSSDAGEDYEQLPSQAQEAFRTEQRRKARAEAQREEMQQSPRRTPREEAVHTNERIAHPYEPLGALDSQTDSQTWFDNLPGHESQDGDGLTSQPIKLIPKHEPSEDPLPYDEVYARWLNAEHKLKNANKQLEEQHHKIILV